MTNIIIILAIGLVGGVASGLFGIGGAVIIVPLLVSILHFNQKMAQGTALLIFLISPAMIAAYQYFKSGNAHVKTSIILWIGVFVGSAIGAWIVNTLLKDVPMASLILRRSFAVIMVSLAVKMWFQ